MSWFACLLFLFIFFISLLFSLFSVLNFAYTSPYVLCTIFRFLFILFCAPYFSISTLLSCV
jgi:hypothetical protein